MMIFAIFNQFSVAFRVWVFLKNENTKGNIAIQWYFINRVVAHIQKNENRQLSSFQWTENQTICAGSMKEETKQKEYSETKRLLLKTKER